MKAVKLGLSPSNSIFATEQTLKVMYGSEDLERFYFKYQTESLLHGLSLQSFCLSNKVPYNIFSKWYRDTRRKVVAVQVDDRPSESSVEKSGQPIQVASRQSWESKCRPRTIALSAR